MDNLTRANALLHAADVLCHHGRQGSVKDLLAVAPEVAGTIAALSLTNRMIRKPGVSVVMATYKGAGRITRALQSLAGQSLEAQFYEVIIVCNGPEDGTSAVVEEFAASHPALNIRLMFSDPPGAGHARNVGSAAAYFDHMTFLDDDDFLSQNFLQELYALSDGRSVIFSQIVDFDEAGEKESFVNTRLIEAFAGRHRLKPADAPGAGTALTMTCIKLFPTFLAEQVQYDPELRNGEDVVYWTEILARFDPDLVLCPPKLGAIYYRENRQYSISRQPTSFQFNVLDRIAVAQRLQQIHAQYPTSFVEQRALSAAAFIVTYLRENRQDLRLVLDMLPDPDMGMAKYICAKLSRTLAVSFCFPPWADTAGIVAAKRLSVAVEPCDVISNEMSRHRKQDLGLLGIAHDLIGEHVETRVPSVATFDHRSTMAFAQQALTHALRLHKARDYRKLYSRAMWPASHFAAGAIKAALPDLHWVAEFSDPLVVDILSKPRQGVMDMGWLQSSGVLAAIEASGFAPLQSDNLMEWCEFIAYALAEEVLFTNSNQRDYMLGQPWIIGQAHRILKKSVIRPHPTLPPASYGQGQGDWRPDPGRINIAYFGSFYQTRGLSEVLDAMARLDASCRTRLQFDIYTAANADLLADIYRLGLSGLVRLRQALPFFDFLARCKAYDFLLVNDAATLGIKPVNPYLPSKLSDYLGAGRAIWALVETASPLDMAKMPVGSMRTPLGDVDAYEAALRSMVRIRMP